MSGAGRRRASDVLVSDTMPPAPFLRTQALGLGGAAEERAARRFRAGAARPRGSFTSWTDWDFASSIQAAGRRLWDEQAQLLVVRRAIALGAAGRLHP